MTTITKLTKEQLIEEVKRKIAVAERYPNSDVARIEVEIFKIALASLDADKPELKIAELINKFYERYPLASFNKDTDRAEALGYFLAGAELQCFGEFIKYEELLGDE
ncbi:hypothetical protein GMM32_03995 [Salmonella enterica subsp. diarizonae]|nr:hypothetical protein [Salmonella enterica subsp. diarizonae]EHG9469466.1 hypothetical protein [Salmonella enterica subsp. enterica serovar Newport]ECJ2855768.1 hypothetical protein [Salmonella enterica subsp. diarizonae]EDT7600655.1 hypothetical protein [Salmonella enterica subsp. diarizonae]EDU8206786.1 hypothetical protein [Salmonella enterica subsp. diarizonae]